MCQNLDTMLHGESRILAMLYWNHCIVTDKEPLIKIHLVRISNAELSTPTSEYTTIPLKHYQSASAETPHLLWKSAQYVEKCSSRLGCYILVMFANTVWEYPDGYTRPAQTNLNVHSLSRVAPFNCSCLQLYYLSLQTHTENNRVDAN